jgi:hypothetical protein
MLFTALVLTIPAMTNVALLLFLMYCIYACWGMQMFARVKPGEILDEHVNFQSFGHSLLTLVRCSTGESWNILMYDAAVRDQCDPFPAYDPEYCGPGRAGRDLLPDGRPCKVYEGCGDNLSFFFFLSFSVIVGYVFLNLFIAVIMEGFESVNEATSENAEVEASEHGMGVSFQSTNDDEKDQNGGGGGSGGGGRGSDSQDKDGNVLSNIRNAMGDSDFIEIDSYVCGLTTIEYRYFSSMWSSFDTNLAMALSQERAYALLTKWLVEAQDAACTLPLDYDNRMPLRDEQWVREQIEHSEHMSMPVFTKVRSDFTATTNDDVTAEPELVKKGIGMVLEPNADAGGHLRYERGPSSSMIAIGGSGSSGADRRGSKQQQQHQQQLASAATRSKLAAISELSPEMRLQRMQNEARKIQYESQFLHGYEDVLRCASKLLCVVFLEHFEEMQLKKSETLLQAHAVMSGSTNVEMLARAGKKNQVYMSNLEDLARKDLRQWLQHRRLVKRTITQLDLPRTKQHVRDGDGDGDTSGGLSAVEEEGGGENGKRHRPGLEVAGVAAVTVATMHRRGSMRKGRKQPPTELTLEDGTRSITHTRYIAMVSPLRLLAHESAGLGASASAGASAMREVAAPPGDMQSMRLEFVLKSVGYSCTPNDRKLVWFTPPTISHPPQMLSAVPADTKTKVASAKTATGTDETSSSSVTTKAGELQAPKEGILTLTSDTHVRKLDATQALELSNCKACGPFCFAIVGKEAVALSGLLSRTEQRACTWVLEAGTEEEREEWVAAVESAVLDCIKVHDNYTARASLVDTGAGTGSASGIGKLFDTAKKPSASTRIPTTKSALLSPKGSSAVVAVDVSNENGNRDGLISSNSNGSKKTVV